MALIKGKQFENNSVDLQKINWNAYTVGDSILGVDPNKAPINDEFLKSYLVNGGNESLIPSINSTNNGYDYTDNAWIRKIANPKPKSLDLFLNITSGEAYTADIANRKIYVVKRQAYLQEGDNVILVYNIDTGEEIPAESFGVLGTDIEASTNSSLTVNVNLTTRRFYYQEGSLKQIKVFNLDTGVRIPTEDLNLTNVQSIGELEIDESTNKGYLSDLGADRIFVFNLVDGNEIVAERLLNNIVINNPQYFAIDSVNNKLYLNDRTNDRIVVLNLADQSVITAEQISYGTTVNPIEILVDSVNNKLYGVSRLSGNFQIIVWNLLDQTLITGETITADFLPTYSFIAFNSGNIHIIGTGGIRAYELATKNLISANSYDDILQGANDITISGNKMFVANHFNYVYNIAEFDINTDGTLTHVKGFGKFLDNGGVIDKIREVEIYNGKAYTPDLDLNMVHVFDVTTGDNLSSETFGSGVLNQPHGIEIDPSNGKAYIVNITSNIVNVFDVATGTHLSAEDFGSGILNSPRSIKLFKGKAYVTNINSGLVNVFDVATGTHLSAEDFGSDVLNQPNRIEIFDSKIYITDANNFNAELRVFDFNTREPLEGEYISNFVGTSRGIGFTENNLYLSDVYEGGIYVHNLYSDIHNKSISSDGLSILSGNVLLPSFKSNVNQKNVLIIDEFGDVSSQDITTIANEGLNDGNGTTFNIANSAYDLGGTFDSPIELTDNQTTKTGIQLLGFGETSTTDSTGVDYSSLVYNSLVPKKYVDDAISLSETNTALTFDNGLTLTGNTVQLGGTVNKDTNLSVIKNLNLEFFNTVYTDNPPNTASTVPSFNGSGAGIYDASNEGLLESIVGYINSGSYETFLLIRDSNNDEFYFTWGVNPTGWTGATIMSGAYVIQTVIDTHGLIYVRETEYTNFFSDILIYDTTNKTVTRLSTHIPALTTIYADTAYNINIWDYVSVKGFPDNSGNYIACVYDNVSDTTYVYNSSTSTLKSYQVGTAVTGAVTAVPAYNNARVALEPSTVTNTILLETDGISVNDRFLEIDIVNDTTTYLSLGITQANLDLYLDKLATSTFKYGFLSYGNGSGLVNPAYMFTYVFNDEIIFFNSENASFAKLSDSISLSNVNTRWKDLNDANDFVSNSHLHISWSIFPVFSIKTNNLEINKLYNIEIGFFSAFNILDEITLYKFPDDVYTGNGLFPQDPILGNILYTGSLIYGTSNEVNIADVTTSIFNISKGSYGFQYPSTYSPDLDNLVTRRYLENDFLNNGNGTTFNIANSAYDLGGTFDSPIELTDNQTTKTGIQYLGFGETSTTDSTGVNYSSLAYNSLTPKKYVDDEIALHADLTNNPHSVTKTQVGLDNVDNTSDANKPISTATQSALDLKLSDLSTQTTDDLAEGAINEYSKWEIIQENPFNLKVPTETEWDNEKLSWSSSNSEGAFASTLKLPLAGYRYNKNGSLFYVGTFGNYWSSSVSSSDSRYLLFNSNNADMYTNYRALGLTVRLIVDGTFTQTEFDNNYLNETVTIDNLTYSFVYNPTTQKIWLDRNLGATQVATSSTDTNAYGDLFQWGRDADGHEKRTSTTRTTLSSTDTPEHGDFILAPNEPYDWRDPQNDNLWQGVNGINNPVTIEKLIGKDNLKASYLDLLDKPNLDNEITNNNDVLLNTDHRGLTNNPHSVTKDQVGLANVDNTSDANKPISTATQSALDLKAEAPNKSSIETADDVQTQIDSISIANNTFKGFEVKLTATQDDLSNTKFMKIEGGIKNDGRNVSLVGSINKTTIVQDTNASLWDVSVTADNTNDALLIEVIGAVNSTIKWVVETSLIEVAVPVQPK